MRAVKAKEYPDYGILMNKRICVVEDDRDQMEIIRGLLKDSECEATYLRSGQAAWRWLGNERVDLILIDVMMPDLDGWEVCSRLREAGANQTTPIIFTTCLIRREQEKLMSDPVARTLSLAKPIKRSTLFRAIGEVLGEKD